MPAAFAPPRHIRGAPEPDKSIGIIQLVELPDDTNSRRFLGFDKLSIKQFDKNISHPWTEGILPQLNDWTAVHV